MPMWMDGGILIGVARPYILLLETKQSGKYMTYQMNLLVTNGLSNITLPDPGSVSRILNAFVCMICETAGQLVFLTYIILR
ncbi:unnamed protein product [Trifolium pratense]|uniref:Uncharacterized protein n=1 Tax=Trifolium pratense TaxID=57577 RepID=A0ACB0JMK3_TRIPR|nr:unnamed protein product [Trifolium pratense]